MADEGVAKVMKEETDKDASPEVDMDVDIMDDKAAAEWVYSSQFMYVYWPFSVVFIRVIKAKPVVWKRDCPAV